MTWVLTASTGTVFYLVRGHQAKRTDESVRLVEVGAAVRALVDAIGVVDFASNDFAAQNGPRTRFTAGFLSFAELADGWRQDRPALGIARALERTLEYDRRNGAAGREFSMGPLHALTAAHLRLTMTAAGFPELSAAADSAADAAGELDRRGHAVQECATSCPASMNGAR